MSMFGATGKFPHGKLDPSDEGELQLGIAVDHRQQIVRIAFGKPVAWLGLGKIEALQFADIIRKNAEKLE